MKRLYRSRQERKIAGICGGVGEMFSLDPTLVRFVMVLIAFATGVIPVLLAYLVGWVIIPEAPSGGDEQEEGESKG